MPNILGIGVVFVVATGVDDADTDDNGIVSTIDVVGSVTIVVVVDVPFATSSITSSICDRDVVAVDAFVTVDFSLVRFDEETIFDTIVMRSFDCDEGVETLVVVVVGVTVVVVCRDC